jgi:hypothetical protein
MALPRSETSKEDGMTVPTYEFPRETSGPTLRVAQGSEILVDVENEGDMMCSFEVTA